MPFKQIGEIRFFYFDIFTPYALPQGVFTRSGGVSPTPWSSLNLGGTVGDERENVVENRRRIFEVVGRKVESLFDCWQVHGTTVICTHDPRPLDSAPQKADVIITDNPAITLFMRFADCVPIFLYDPRKKVVGIVHAGWQGTVKKAPYFAVQAMERCYGSKPVDILAGIGPSISVDHYEVGVDVTEQFQQAYGKQADCVLFQKNSHTYLDLWKANALTLNEAGVRDIETAGLCTACHTDDWFSHRAEKGKTGRFGALIALEGASYG